MFNYKLKRFQVWKRHIFNRRPILNENEELAKKIVIKFLHQPHTTYFMTPTGKYYIQTDGGEYTILLGDGYVKLTNHNYVYEVNLHPKVVIELIMLVRKAIDKASNKMDRETFINETEMLTQILNK